MQGKRKHYFVCANSSSGFKNLVETNIIGLKKGYILNGDYESSKAEILKSLATYFTDEGYDIECIHSCFEPDQLEGIILLSKSIGIFSSHCMTPEARATFEVIEVLNMNRALAKTIDKQKEKLMELTTNSSICYTLAYESFAKAILVHDEWEKIYIDHMDFDKANHVATDVVATLFDHIPQKQGGVTKHRFFGGATYKGSLDFVMDLTDHLAKRYFIKGRPGSGKSTMLKKIQAKAEELGYEVEVYHCGFDPKSLDMILIEELNFCIFDSTAPHEYFPSTARDYVIDMYAELIEEGTDETYAEELKDIKERYKALVNGGVGLLKEGKSYQDKYNAIYHCAYNDQIMKQILLQLFKDILSSLS